MTVDMTLPLTFCIFHSITENNITLQQCMELFTEPEVLSPEEAWYEYYIA